MPRFQKQVATMPNPVPNPEVEVFMATVSVSMMSSMGVDKVLSVQVRDHESHTGATLVHQGLRKLFPEADNITLVPSGSYNNTFWADVKDHTGRGFRTGVITVVRGWLEPCDRPRIQVRLPRGANAPTKPASPMKAHGGKVW